MQIEYKESDVRADRLEAEHAQRITLQHHAADMAQRVADLEAERDELRARLAEDEAQEPVAWMEQEWSGSGERRLYFTRRQASIRDDVVRPVWTALYARPTPEPTLANGLTLADTDASASVAGLTKKTVTIICKTGGLICGGLIECSEHLGGGLCGAGGGFPCEHKWEQKA